MLSPSKIAVLGTGLMGAPMARRLLGSSFPLTVWNRTASKAEALVAEGAVRAASPAEAVGDADIVLSMLENGPITEDVLFGQGVAGAMSEGTIVLDMASIPPGMARDHALRLRPRRIHHVDAPVSGGVVGAEQGTLAIMAGGDLDVVRRLSAVMEPLGRVTHVGPHGAGQLAKLANQAIVGITIGAVSEALLLAAAGGADPAAVRDAIRGGFAESRILELHGGRMVERNFVPGAPSSIQLKDLDTVLAEAEALSLDLPIVRTVRDLYASLVARGQGGVDHSGLLLEIEHRNEGRRIGDKPDRLPT
jgi:2-hydroxy-3-oxopropionate reductase